MRNTSKLYSRTADSFGEAKIPWKEKKQIVSNGQEGNGRRIISPHFRLLNVRPWDSEMGNLRNPLENLVKDIPVVSDYIKILNVFFNILTWPLRTKASEGDF